MGNPKSILQLCHGYGPPFDDVARQWKILFDGMDYRVITVFLTGRADQSVAKLVGGDVVFLGYSSKDLRGLKRKQIHAVQALHNKYDFCLTIAHRYKPIYIATHLEGISVLGVAHAYRVFDKFWRRRYITRFHKKVWLFGVSDAIRNDIRRSLPQFPPNRIQTAYNHIDVKKARSKLLSRDHARELLGLPADLRVVGNVGRLHADKDQKTLIKAFAKAAHRLDKTVLAIIGTGRLERALKQQAVACGISDKVFFIGRVPEASRYFSAFDLFVLTSNHEPFGMVLLEAMVADLPIISTSVGGAPEILGGSGVLFDVGDSERLAALLCSDLDKPQYDDRLALFDDETAARNFMEFMRDNDVVGWP